MKFLFLIFFLFCVPSVYANLVYEDFYTETFDTNFGIADIPNNTQFGNVADSDYTYTFTTGGAPAGDFVESENDGSDLLAPYSWYCEMYSVDNCEPLEYNMIKLDTSINMEDIYNGEFFINVKAVLTVGNWANGSYKLGICDDSVGCTETDLIYETDMTWGLVSYTFPTDFNNIPDLFYQVDTVYIKTFPYTVDCTEGVDLINTHLLYNNLTIKRFLSVPHRVRIMDSTNGVWAEDVNVTWSGTEYHTNLTDSNGYAFYDVGYMENGSYTVDITKLGYYDVSWSGTKDSCSVDISDIDTDLKYAESCGELFSIYELPTVALKYNFHIVDINNQPINNTLIILSQTQYPYSEIRNTTDNTGYASMFLESTTTYNYELQANNYNFQAGSISTNQSNETKTFILLTESGCSSPLTISPVGWAIFVRNFSNTHTQTFIYALESIDYLQEFEWKLNGNVYSHNYPSITIIFTTTGNNDLSVKSTQTGCLLSYNWEIYLSEDELYNVTLNYTIDEPYTKESFLGALKVYVPSMFVLTIILCTLTILKRVGKRKIYYGGE